MRGRIMVNMQKETIPKSLGKFENVLRNMANMGRVTCPICGRELVVSMAVYSDILAEGKAFLKCPACSDDRQTFQAYDSLQAFYKIELEKFKAYWATGQYKKRSHVPNYNQVKILLKALNVMRPFWGWDLLKLKKEVAAS